jgi:hypothetical protein
MLLLCEDARVCLMALSLDAVRFTVYAVLGSFVNIAGFALLISGLSLLVSGLAWRRSKTLFESANFPRFSLGVDYGSGLYEGVSGGIVNLWLENGSQTIEVTSIRFRVWAYDQRRSWYLRRRKVQVTDGKFDSVGPKQQFRIKLENIQRQIFNRFSGLIELRRITGRASAPDRLQLTERFQWVPLQPCNVDLLIHLSFKPNMMHARRVAQQIRAQLTLQMEEKDPDNTVTFGVHDVQML